MPDFTLTLDRSTRKVTAGLSDLAPFTLGDKVSFSLAIVRKTGDTTEKSDLPVRAVRASIGRTLAPPLSGLFSLASTKLDTTPIAISGVSFDADAAALLTALGGLLWVTAVTKPAPCTWVLTTTRTEHDSAPPPITVTANSLAPSSFVRIRPYIESGFWQVEIRLIQEPLAFTSTVVRVLAPSPSVRRIRAGSAELLSAGIEINEVQSLKWPANFDGTFILTFDYRQSQLIGAGQRSGDEIATVLNALHGDGGVRFKVTVPVDNELYVEFIGLLGSKPQNLITVTVETFAPGALTFALDLGRAAMCSAFRGLDEKGKPITALTLPFEISADIVEDGEDPEDMSKVARPFTLLQTTVPVVREQIFDELETVEPIVWNNPPQPVSYVPFVANQVVTGQQHYSAAIGNGTLTFFDIAHNLGTRLLACPPMVSENADGGEIYTHGLDYTATITNANTVRLTFPSAPSAAALMVTITTAGPKTAFVAGVTFTESQVIGLLDDLAILGARVGALEVLAPAALGHTRSLNTEKMSFDLPTFTAIWPGRLPLPTVMKLEVPLPEPEKLLPPRWLFPAIHDAVAASASLPLADPADFAGQVFVNNTGSALTISGAGGLTAISVPVGGFYGSDGRAWLALTREAATSSYFPTGYERELFLLPVSEQQFRLGKVLRIAAVLTVQTLRANTRVKGFLVIDVGIPRSQTSPGTTAENLEDILWDATPLLLHPILFTPAPLEIAFGAAVLRAIGGTMTTEQTLYGETTTGGTVPSSPTFVLRARLIRFDTENTAANARGYLAAKCANINVSISS